MEKRSTRIPTALAARKCPSSWMKMTGPITMMNGSTYEVRMCRNESIQAISRGRPRRPRAAAPARPVFASPDHVARVLLRELGAPSSPDQ